MAQRLATEYVKAYLKLTEAEMTQFVQIFSEHRVMIQVKVFENGNQEMVFHDDSGEELVLRFERKSSIFVSVGSYRVSTPELANLMRKAVAKFKGDAIVNRIYPAFTMVYYYERGTVVKIMELTKQNSKIIYEYKNTLGKLEDLFHKENVEHEIQIMHSNINHLLDLRNEIKDEEIHKVIDERLHRITHRLFVLEA